LPDLLGEILETTVKLKKNGYNYDFSVKTLKAKEDYDEEVEDEEEGPDRWDGILPPRGGYMN
jgi:hypothetical protein